MDDKEDLNGFEQAIQREREKHACPRCRGRGLVSAASVSADPFMRISGETGCPDCGGTRTSAGTGRTDKLPLNELEKQPS